MKKISVLMSVYNGEKYLKDSIQSILSQTYKNFVFIIIDDHSSDKSFDIIKSFRDKRIHVIKNSKHRGLTYSLNKALKLSNSTYIARMDADDISLPKRLETQVHYLENHPKVVMVGSWVDLIDKNNNKIRQLRLPISYEEIKRSILFFNPFIHPTVMIRKSILDKVGKYDEKLDGAEDYDLFLRIASKYRVVNLRKTLVKFRKFNNSTTWNKMKKTEYAAILARIKGVRMYGYSYGLFCIAIVKPLAFYFIPSHIKRLILRSF